MWWYYDYDPNSKPKWMGLGDLLKQSTTANGSILDKFQTVNTDDFDIIPKKSKIEKDLAAAEERKRNAEKSKEMSVAAYDRQILAIDDEIKELKKKLK